VVTSWVMEPPVTPKLAPATRGETRRERSRWKLAASSVALAAVAGSVFALPAWLAACLLAAVLVLELALRDRSGAVVAGVFLVTLGVAALPVVGIWPAPGAVALLALAALAWFAPSWRAERRWLVRGRIDRPVIGLVIGSVVIASTALFVWYVTLHSDVSDIRRAMLPPYPAWMLILGGVAFSMVNAAVEEALFRGLLLDVLDRALGTGVSALLVQAGAFGLLHIHGFPRGLVGVALAAVYGLMMGILRRRSGGMLAPWIGHVATDVAIVSILVLLP
jgi:uncharacterized protein